MSKKLLIAIFVLSLVAVPATTKAGFFDFFRINQTAQVKTATMVKGDNLVLQVQQALTAQGFYKGDISGVVGARTKTAIKSFQKMNNLPVTGLLDETTVNAILKSGGPQGGGVFQTACNSSTAPWIRVNSPNGGETYQTGQQVTVTWTDCNIPPNHLVNISLETSNYSQSQSTALASSTLNDGNEQVTLPAGVTGTYYVQVNTLVPNFYTDFSNNSFSIIGGEDNIHYGTSACGMEVLTPNPEVNLYGGQSNTFTTLVKIQNTPGQDCAWGEFEGMIGNVRLIDTTSNNIFAEMEVDGQPIFWQAVSVGDPENMYTTDRYFVATLQFVNPLPSMMSNNLYLHYTENNEGPNGPMPNPDQLFMPINVTQ